MLNRSPLEFMITYLEVNLEKYANDPALKAQDVSKLVNVHLLQNIWENALPADRDLLMRQAITSMYFALKRSNPSSPLAADLKKTCQDLQVNVILPDKVDKNEGTPKIGMRQSSVPLYNAALDFLSIKHTTTHQNKLDYLYLLTVINFGVITREYKSNFDKMNSELKAYHDHDLANKTKSFLERAQREGMSPENIKKGKDGIFAEANDTYRQAARKLFDHQAIQENEKIKDMTAELFGLTYYKIKLQESGGFFSRASDFAKVLKEFLQTKAQLKVPDVFKPEEPMKPVSEWKDGSKQNDSGLPPPSRS